MDFPAWFQTQLNNRKTNAYGVSHLLDVVPATVYNWLKGENAPNPDNCREIARRFGVPEEDVMILAGHLSADANRPPVPEPNPQTQRLLHIFSTLEPDNRQRILAIMLTLKELQDD